MLTVQACVNNRGRALPPQCVRGGSSFSLTQRSRPPEARSVEKQSREANDRTPLTEEQIRAHTLGELQPLSAKVSIVDYDPHWPELFRREADRIRAALGGRARQ